VIDHQKAVKPRTADSKHEDWNGVPFESSEAISTATAFTVTDVMLTPKSASRLSATLVAMLALLVATAAAKSSADAASPNAIT